MFNVCTFVLFVHLVSHMVLFPLLKVRMCFLFIYMVVCVFMYMYIKHISI